MLLRCIPTLPALLAPSTLLALETIAAHRVQPAAITANSPWKWQDTCGCPDCRHYGVSAQDNFIQKEVYRHMNTHRTLEDQEIEGQGPYAVGEVTSVRHMFEANLGLRSRRYPYNPRCGLGLHIVNQCFQCGGLTYPPGELDLQVSTGYCKPFPGMPPTSSTQQLVDQLIGADCLLDHLSDDETEQLAAVKKFGTRCLDARCNKDGWADTVLPCTLDDTKPLPPLLRVNKRIFDDDFSAITDTLVITTSENTQVVYKLLAVVYGNSKHFTADIRYHIDTGNEQFHHYDAWNFRQDRVLELSNNLPACMGGQPTFLPRHTQNMRHAFQTHTKLRNVTAAIYGNIAHPDYHPILNL
jgi:hypothetical protein